MEPTTIKVASDDTESGYIIINESDFDPKTMKKYREPKPEPKDPPAPPTPPAV